MSNSLLKSLSLKSLFARAIPLTLGAATLLVVVLICSLIVLEVTTRSLPIAEPREELVLVFDLRERIVIQTSEVSPTHAGFFTLERAVMFPIEPAPTDFVTLGTESLWKRATPNLPRHRVQFVGYSQAVPTCWYFHNHGERAEYVLFDPRTERRLGSVGRHGFKAAPLTPDEQFDTSNHRLNQRIRFGQQHPFRDALAVSNRPHQQRDHDGEFLLQDDDRRVYWINFEKQTSTLLHDGERVLSVVTFPFLDGHSRGIALRLEDRIILKSWWEPFDTIDVIVLPLTVRQQPSFTWVPGVRSSGGSYGEEIYVVAGRTHEIVWAQRTGEVLRQKSVTLRDPRHENNVVDGMLVEIPAYLMWAFGLVQAPAFSWWLIGGAVEPGASIVGGGFDAEVALPAMYGTTQREVWLNTWRANVWPLLATQALALVWVGLGQRRLKRWAATRRERWFWGCWIAVFGLPGYLALRVQRSWPALKTCKACSGEVPCDRAACTKCGAEVVGGRDGEVGRDVRTGRTDGPGDPSYTGERPARRRVGQRLLGLSVGSVGCRARSGRTGRTRAGDSTGTQRVAGGVARQRTASSDGHRTAGDGCVCRGTRTRDGRAGLPVARFACGSHSRHSDDGRRIRRRLRGGLGGDRGRVGVLANGAGRLGRSLAVSAASTRQTQHAHGDQTRGRMGIAAGADRLADFGLRLVGLLAGLDRPALRLVDD